jgi:acetyl-CoA acetyltransferase
MDTYVLGLAMHPPAVWVANKRLEEMVFDTAKAALDDARIDRQQLDHISIAGCDELDGRSISSMLLSAPAGAYLKDEIKTTDSGLIGFCLEAMRIESGRYHLGLLSSWNKSSTAPLEDVMRMRCEPFFTRPIGLNMSIADGLFAQSVSYTYKISAADLSNAVVESYKRAEKNPRGMRASVPSASEIDASPYVAAPLRKIQQAPVTDGGVSMVICSGDWLNKHPGSKPLAKLSGLAWRIDEYQLGSERLGSLNGFKETFKRATSMTDFGQTQLNVVELDSQTAFHDVAFRRALDLSAGCEVSPSGGPFAQNPYFCSGLVQAAEAVLQVSGRAGAVQVKNAKRAAAHGCHGFAQQGNAVAVFEGV